MSGQPGTSAAAALAVGISLTSAAFAAPPVVLIDPSPDPIGSIGSSALLTPDWVIVGAQAKRFFAPDRVLYSYGALVLWPRAADGTPSDLPLTLWPQTTIRGARFGESLGLDRETNQLLVGEPGFKTSPTTTLRAVGRVQVVDLSLTPPAATELIVAPVSQVGLEFGTAVALDGLTAAVTAPGFKTEGSTADLGAAYLFARTQGEAATAWSLTTTILPPEGSPTYLGFGSSLALTASNVIVGAPAALAIATHEYGRVYVYDRVDGTAVAMLTAPTPTLGDRFGAVMAHDGDLLAISAPGDECGVGHVHLYRETSGGWAWEATLSAPGTSDEGWTGFGHSLSIDRERVMIGTGGFASETRFGTNAAIFRRAGAIARQPGQTNWILEAVVAPDLDDPITPTGSPVALDPAGALVSESSIGFGQVRYQGLDRAIDLDFDGQVGAGDLALFLGSWGATGPRAADFNGDGTVDQSDLALLLGGWG